MALAAVANCTTLDCFVPELQKLSLSQSRDPGSADFTQGCLLALNESLVVQDGKLAFNQDGQCFFNNPPDCTNISVVQDAAIYGPICGSSNASVPEVVVPYSWCSRNCPGWQRSETTSLSQWIGPLVQFILPCLAFCLSIPRSWKFAVPNVVFKYQSEMLGGLVSYLGFLPLALTIVALDTAFWLSMCFAFAGPMLLSAVYEYTLDRKIIDYLSPPKRPAMPLDAKARFLLCTLVGNLKLDSVNQQPRPPSQPEAPNVAQIQIPSASATGSRTAQGLNLGTRQRRQSLAAGSMQQTSGIASSTQLEPQQENASLERCGQETAMVEPSIWTHIMKIADEFSRHTARDDAFTERLHEYLQRSPLSVQDRRRVGDLMNNRVKPEAKMKALLNAQARYVSLSNSHAGLSKPR